MVPIPSLLVMPFAGFLASTAGGEIFSLPVILVINSAAALTGSMLSYMLGRFGGKPLLLKYGKWVFVRPKDIDKTEQYFRRRGGMTVLIARFLPVVRHLISIPAGIAKMPLPKFLTQTFLGATIWGGGLMVLGYILGEQWEGVAKTAKKFDLGIAAVIVVALLAIGIRFVVVRRRERHNEKASSTKDNNDDPKAAA
jgi:membrane protein DedA with SNARE-associated domain